MNRRRIAIVAVIAGLAAGGGIAAARVTHYPTTLETKGLVIGPGDRTFQYGHVRSQSLACRAHRTVKLLAHYPDGSTKVLDVDRSSTHGAFALLYDFAGADGATVRAPRKRIGRPGHRRICDAASVPAD